MVISQEMEFMDLTELEKKVLLNALNIDSTKLKCKYCNKETTLAKCGIMPPLNKEGSGTIITCDSVLCLSTYLTELDEFEEKNDIKVQ